MPDIHYFTDYISPKVHEHLLGKAVSISGVDGLHIVGGIDPKFAHLETPEALAFVCALYEATKAQLNTVLTQRTLDRQFIDDTTLRLKKENEGVAYHDPNYKTIIGLRDDKNRVVVGPLSPHYHEAHGEPVALIPDYLQGPHVTLFGPPDTEKMSINAMNAYHRRMPNEPAIIAELLAKASEIKPLWGADNEDSKTPLTGSFLQALANLMGCYNKTLAYTDPKKDYKLEHDHLSQPIKRFPGLALPSMTHFINGNPIPMHLYDFALHMFHLWENKEALVFYVPKLENEEEAAYLKHMIETAEKMLQKQHPEYQLGTVKIVVVVESPRIISRLNEVIDALDPYFAGASLGWHDYLAATARLFKEDPHYQIPVKADPKIVINNIAEAHRLLAEVVGGRGGIKIGGMYGVLPKPGDAASFEVCMVGYIRDIITQLLKRDLDGFWVAHPDFVRIGIALVIACKAKKDDSSDQSLEKLICALVTEPENQDMLLQLIVQEDVAGLQLEDLLYPRALLAAEIVHKPGDINNNNPEEVRYNIFQALQYLADWLAGNGCVALPAQISNASVRIMDDLATTERSCWEVRSELRHGRLSLKDFMKIAHEEFDFIHNNLNTANKEVQVKWNDRTAKWYPVAFNLLLRLMTDEKPVEFATELLLGFTIDSVRNAPDPWAAICAIDPEKYAMPQALCDDSTEHAKFVSNPDGRLNQSFLFSDAIDPHKQETASDLTCKL